MEKLQKLAIILLILVSLVPAYYINKWLQRIVLPRKSFGRLMVYLLLAFLLVFVYSFLLVLLIAQLFPDPKR